MKITGCFYGYASKGKAAFGVQLHYGDTEYLKVIKLKEATTNSAELYAAEYALKCIKNRNTEVELESCNSYVPRLFEKVDGTYKTKAERNVDMVVRAREAATDLNLSVVMKKSDAMIKLQELVRNAVNGKD